MAVDKPCTFIAVRECQSVHQMQHCLTKRDADTAFANEQRWHGEFNDEYTTEIDQTTVSNGGHGNVESWKALREAVSYLFTAIEIGAAASGDTVHDEPPFLQECLSS